MNIYIGFGIKYGGPVFLPEEPAIIQNDPEGLSEHPEPNPKDKPEEIEPDTDKEDNEENEEEEDN